MSLLHRHLFGEKVAAEVEGMGLLAEQIADRWAGGWPRRITALIRAEKLLPALRVALLNESAIQRRVESSELSHLARHEILELYGADIEPPFPENVSESASQDECESPS